MEGSAGHRFRILVVLFSLFLPILSDSILFARILVGVLLLDRFGGLGMLAFFRWRLGGILFVIVRVSYIFLYLFRIFPFYICVDILSDLFP